MILADHFIYDIPMGVVDNDAYARLLQEELDQVSPRGYRIEAQYLPQCAVRVTITTNAQGPESMEQFQAVYDAAIAKTKETYAQVACLAKLLPLLRK